MSAKPIPQDLGGMQKVMHGIVQDGDLLVGGAMRDKWWATSMFFGWSIDGEHIGNDGNGLITSPSVVHRPIEGISVYRVMPVPSQRTTDDVIATTTPATEVGHGLKPTNTKDIVGSDKLPLHLWPTSAKALGALALLDGMLKYGRSNFRADGVRASIYYDATNRHLDAWFEGEDVDPDSGLPHLAHALACIAVLVDAQEAGKFTDDRLFPANYRALADALTPHVARLKAKHAGRDPKHYTINDR